MCACLPHAFNRFMHKTNENKNLAVLVVLWWVTKKRAAPETIAKYKETTFRNIFPLFCLVSLSPFLFFCEKNSHRRINNGSGGRKGMQ